MSRQTKRWFDGKELKFLLGGTDPDLNTTLIYKSIDLPTGSSLDSNTGEFKWIPDAAQVGVHNVSFTVSDGEETVKRIVTIKVRNQIDAPKLSIDLTPGFPVLPGQRVIVNALADSEADIAGFKVVLMVKRLILSNQMIRAMVVALPLYRARLDGII